jgi:hypothetical protein
MREIQKKLIRLMAGNRKQECGFYPQKETGG